MRKHRKKAASVARPVSSALGEVATPPKCMLIAVELGGEWPSQLAAEGCERRVIVQLEGEAPAVFTDRIATSIDALLGRGLELGTLALACNERVDGAIDEARRSLVGLALGAMAKRRAGKVFLTASP